MATLKDIARKVNRSVTTVSRALAGFSDVSPEIVALVRKTADEMGYVPNIQARRLQKQTTDTIGVIAPISSKGYSEPFFCEFLSGVGEAASDADYDLLVAYSARKENDVDLYKKLISERKVDGFVLYRIFVDDPRINYLKQLNFPFTVFGQSENTEGYDFIDVDGSYAMSLVVDHLVRQGHDQILCLCPSLTLMATRKRLDGLKLSLAKKGITEFTVNVGCYNEHDGYKAVMKHLSGNPRHPTAVVCFNDSIAFGAINAIKDSHFRVGKDIAVTGFDDIPMAQYYRPPLTTIRQPIHFIGKRVAEMLFSRLADQREGRTHTPCHILLKPKLIVRSSTDNS